ncbi:unnamed protein product [Paramecium octaurelia]|uniref:Uncharacterized protein n=1 Tax=Paramecium octaurelia TaxID=43137 RepID=A0A8S1V6Y7_PAROT|nr:unnamed protein product [Paramecium octaurelia]
MKYSNNPQFQSIEKARRESPQTDRLKVLTEKWSNLKQGLDKEKNDKKELVEQHIQRIESLLNQERPKEEQKFKTLKDHLLKLQDQVYQEKNDRELFDELKQKDLRNFEEQLTQQVEDEKSNKRKLELQLLKQIEERFNSLISIKHNQKIEWRTMTMMQSICL